MQNVLKSKKRSLLYQSINQLLWKIQWKEKQLKHCFLGENESQQILFLLPGRKNLFKIALTVSQTKDCICIFIRFIPFTVKSRLCLKFESPNPVLRKLFQTLSIFISNVLRNQSANFSFLFNRRPLKIPIRQGHKRFFQMLKNNADLLIDAKFVVLCNFKALSHIDQEI